jgi:SulP family sulfate permease
VALFKCDSCGYERDVPNKLVGKKAKCPECGHGVTIFNDDLAEDLAAMFEEDEPDREEELPGVGDREYMDLDNANVVVELPEKEDVLCDACGSIVVEKDGATFCQDCGKEFEPVQKLTELEEGDLDVSGLTNDPPPQVWETNYEAESNVPLEEDDEHVKSVPFFAGNPALNVFAGLVSGSLGFFFALAMSLLASSQIGMYDYLPTILSTALVGMGVGSVFFSLQSRIPFGLAGPGTALTGVLFFFLGAIYQDMVGLYEPEIILPTLLAAIALTALLAGAGLWIIGVLKAGNLIRYVPLQVVGGVMGGVGVFIVIGALDWIGHLQLDWSHLLIALKDCILQLHPAQSLSVMGPSIVFGLILFFGLARYKNSLFLLGVLLVASAVGYGASFWGSDPAIVSLASPITEVQDSVPFLSMDILRMGFGNIQWDIIRDHGHYIGALGCLIALTAMYRITRLEMLLGREVDLSKEFRSLGVTNIISGLCGGMPAAVSFGRSAGNHASGARGPLAGIVAGLVVMVGLYHVNELVAFIPRFVPEGLLLFAGLALIRGWMFKARTAFTRRDDLWMLWVTFLATVIFGMLIGIGFGVALAFMVTVRRNSLGGSVRNVLSGATHLSNVDRAPAQQRVLKEYGDHIHIVRLQGFLFLGSLQDLLDDLRVRLSDKNLLQVEYVILDFKMVTGLASAAGIGFKKLYRLMDEYDVELVIASAPLELEQHFEDTGLLGEGGGFRVFLDLNYAMEWCENRVLDGENLLHLNDLSLAKLLEPVFPVPEHIPALMKVLKKVVFYKGDVVLRQGEVSDSMYFVESGRLDVELELEGRKVIRLKKVGPGAVFGEMGIYTLAPRSATVRASEQCTLYLMTTSKLEAIEKRAPQLVMSIHRYMINMLAERLAEANFKVRELMR